MANAIMEKTAAQGARPRMAFVDNIRWTVIAMVVLMHACVTYSGMGSWYYVEKGTVGTAAFLAFAVYQIFSQAFFMGLLFFVAAIFTPGAYDRKGFGRFLLDRFVRLGVPTLLYMLVLHPLTVTILAAGTGEHLTLAGVLQRYGQFVASGDFIGASGPLWFAFALLLFSIVYALVRLILDAVRASSSRTVSPVTPTSRAVHLAALVLVAVIGVVTFFVRIVQPIGTSVANMQLCYFTQYIVLFILGLWAGRKGILPTLPRQASKIWLRLSLAVGLPVWLIIFGLGGALEGNQAAYLGGWHWQAAALAVWEAFFCVSFSIGLLGLYRERVNGRGRVTGLLSETSFGIYVFHAPILVGVTMLMRALTTFPLAKAFIAAVIAWLIALGVAWLVRRIPGVGKLFA